jgi:nicotinate-nucleotide adenylyltransferase
MTPAPPATLIFGGTFDPPHLAHAVLPSAAAQLLRCGRILYVPAAINPLKQATPPTHPHHRLAMLALALRHVRGAEICTIELDRERAHPGEPSYTIDTLRALRQGLPRDASMRLLIGADQALEFHRWKDWQAIVALAPPAVMLREPWNAESFAERLSTTFPSDEATRWLGWTLLEGLPRMDISASEIRSRVVAGASLDGLLDPEVAHYIRVHRLYHG